MELEVTIVKSRSEICKDYRKRLKLQDNEGYLHKERERRRKNYVATSLLNSSDKAARRQQTREAVRRCRERKKRAQEHHAETDQDTSGYESVQSSRKESMIVSMGFPNRKAGPKKRLTKQLNQAKKTIAELKKENESLARRLKTEQRRRQRIVKSVQSSPKTPRSKTERLMNNAGLTRMQKDKVRKSIMFGDVLAKQLLSSKQVRSRSSVSKLSKTVAGQIIRKYKMNGMLGRKLCLGKNTMSKYTSITPETSRPENVQITRKFEREIKEFLERDDNSRVQPGKADTVKCNGGLKQVRVLTDYMGNLHQKFISENVQCNVSFATFCRVRPKNIKLATFISRSSCLCTQHQNMALTAKTLRREGVQVSVNPEVFVKSNIDNETLEATLADNTKVPQWKRVDIEERGKRKQVMRIVDIEMTKQEFIEHIDKQRQGFSAHIDRVKSQYAGIRSLKQNLPDNHVVIQMDFAENFSCTRVV